VQANIQAWRDMEKHLTSYKLSIGQTPVVLQCNKQDLLGALALGEMRSVLRVQDMASYPAVAMNGEGVLETLKAITRSVITQVQHQTAVA
jgi:signal recognition particle receptor subunit beta